MRRCSFWTAVFAAVANSAAALVSLANPRESWVTGLVCALAAFLFFWIVREKRREDSSDGSTVASRQRATFEAVSGTDFELEDIKLGNDLDLDESDSFDAGSGKMTEEQLHQLKASLDDDPSLRLDLAASDARDHAEADAAVREQLRVKKSSKLAAAGTLLLLLMTLLAVPSPNSFVSVLHLFNGIVLLLLTYAWFTEVCMESDAQTPWLGFLVIINIYALILSSPQLVRYPVCADVIQGMVGQRFQAPLANVPWNCINPSWKAIPVLADEYNFWQRQQLAPLKVSVEKRAGGQWWATGVLPGAADGQPLDAPAPAAADLALYCSGHPPFSPGAINSLAAGTTIDTTVVMSDTEWLPVLHTVRAVVRPATEGINIALLPPADPSKPSEQEKANPDPFYQGACPDVPTWTHMPSQDVMVQVLLLGSAILGASFVVLRVMAWCRQRGRCVGWKCCRRSYHGVGVQPETI